MNRARETAEILGSFSTLISGLLLSRASATTLTVGPGMASSADATSLMRRTVAITKGLGSFAVGTGNGGLDTGSVASNTWYHVHLIKRDSDGRIDVLLSLSASAPTMPTGWTMARRIGSILTNGSSQITPFVQIGDTFTWSVPVTDVNAANPGTAAVTRALTVPTGIEVLPITTWMINNVTTASVAVLISALAHTDTVPTATLCTIAGGGAAANSRSTALITHIPTNTSAQVRSRLSASGASDALIGVTHGWIDRRGS